ncbi:MAG: hypothetical protein ACE5JA_11105 [bacterium]
MSKVELVGKNGMRLGPGATLGDIYGLTDKMRLPVEPMSRLTTIVNFLSEGGYGYGSLTEGCLASKIFKLSWVRGGKSYEYGLESSTLYNAGYPLQRIVDMGRSTLLGIDFGRITSVSFLGAEPSSPTFRYIDQDLEAVSVPAGATNAIFVNEKAASLFGLKRRGLLATFETGGEGEEVDEAWERRFIEDSLPAGLETVRILTVKSNLKSLVDISGDDSYFLTLACLKGFVVNLYCSARVRTMVNEAVGSLKHCYLF